MIFILIYKSISKIFKNRINFVVKNRNSNIYYCYDFSVYDIILNEESIDYKWCYLDEFIDLIKWYYDKNELKNMLEIYLK